MLSGEKQGTRALSPLVPSGPGHLARSPSLTYSRPRGPSRRQGDGIGSFYTGGLETESQQEEELGQDGGQRPR